MTTGYELLARTRETLWLRLADLLALIVYVLILGAVWLATR
jgi:hypothetical protein